MKKIEGGVCAPQGFAANGIWCGIRKNKDRKDLALIVSDRPCSAAAVYTTNKVKAASVLVTREHLAGGRARAVVCNSGNANACTGEAGMAAARAMARLAAAEIGCRPEEVAVASTGVIGVPLPIAAVESGIAGLAAGLSRNGAAAALDAVMTTDTRRKEVSFEFDLVGKKARIGAMAKGAGMIHPNLATMLCFVTTDAAVEAPVLAAALKEAVRTSFNRVTVDGDTSTNDCVLVLANGAAGNAPVAAGSPAYAAFAAALGACCRELAVAVARDGEGATKLVECSVSGAPTEADAETLAKAVVSSSLVKAACFGADANWGRVLCAMGYSGADFDPASVDVSFSSAAGTVAVCSAGASLPFSEEIAKKVLSEAEIRILVDLRTGGPGAATAWGCDLTYDYVKINGDYRS